MEGGGFRPFHSNVSNFWDAADNDRLVLDSWRHRQVQDSGGGIFDEKAPQQLLPQALQPLTLQQRGLESAGALSKGVSVDSTAVSLSDLRLTQGTSYSGLSLAVDPRSSLSPSKSVAELSERRREAIKAAWRRVDPPGQGWAGVQELTLALQRYSHLEPAEQESLVQSLSSGSGTEPAPGTRVPFAVFTGYYQLLGASIERDRDFEDLVRHHWGFAEVSDLLYDMKNKFAMVGLAYAFRHSLDQGGAQELSLETFQEAIARVGMNYSGGDVSRLFDAFGPSASEARSLEVQRLTQTLTSAPRPTTPVPTLYGVAHFSEVCSELGDTSNLVSQAASPKAQVPEGLPPTVPAPEERPARSALDEAKATPPEAPPEGDEDEGVPAPPEPLAAYSQPLPTAPPEDNDGDTAPEEKPAAFRSRTLADEPTRAPEERTAPWRRPQPQPVVQPQPVLQPQPQPAVQPLPQPVVQPPQPPPEPQQQEQQQQEEPPPKQQESPAQQAPRPQPQEQPQPASPQRPPQKQSAPPQPGFRTSARPTVPAAGPGRRRAVTVGVNYIGTRNELYGCINDSDTFIRLLTEDFGYDVADIRQLRDDHPQRMPSRRNILAALRWLVKGAKDGDHLFFHYSGHGSQQRDYDGDEKDGKDETIVPCDFAQPGSGFISDDDLRHQLVQGLPKGVRLTCIMDCCHSGTALDLPYKALVRSDDSLELRKKQTARLLRPAEGEVVLLSGCKDSQTSADASAGSMGNTAAAGAMTTAFKATITKMPHGSYHGVLTEMRAFLKSHGFSQVPQLSSEHFVNFTDCFLPEADEPPEAPAGPEWPLRPPLRKALTIGINYLSLWPGHGRLAGCINDSETMVGVLREVFGFEEPQICRLRDDHPNTMPTRANIEAALRWLTEGARSGDELFLHYSGHGGQQRDRRGDEADGMDETLIPCDFQTAGQITDDELHGLIVAPLPRGCRLWAVLDCCHSGTVLDLPYKAEVSLDGRSVRLGMASAAAEERRQGRPSRAKASAAEVLMISGCKDSQTSADIQAGSMGAERAAGAMTTAFRHAISRSISCEDLLLTMRSFLKQHRYEQVPQLSSEQFMQLDSRYVAYASGGRRKVPTPAAAPPPANVPAAAPVAPQHQAPMQALPFHQGLGVDTGKYIMDSRIQRLEEQIAQLRMQQQHAPPPPAPSEAHGGSAGVPAPFPLSPGGGQGLASWGPPQVQAPRWGQAPAYTGLPFG